MLAQPTVSVRLRNWPIMSMLTPAVDAAPADWIVGGLRGFVVSVVSVVPVGFSTYLRVFHPAHRRSDGSMRPVRWAEVAAANGSSAHVGMQFDTLVGSDDLYNPPPQRGVFDEAPEVGSLPRDLIDLPLPVLARHTAMPQACWFAAWEGWGDIRRDIAAAPKFHVPARSYHLLAGPIEAAGESMTVHREQSANLWWPDDHSWCVASEIDFNSTYIGCDASCADDIEQLPAAEAFRVDPAACGRDAW
jgi:hypothetical protein